MKRRVSYFAAALLFAASLSLPAFGQPQKNSTAGTNRAVLCCKVVAFNAHTGVLIVTEASAGKTVMLTVERFGPIDGVRLTNALKTGSKVGFGPIDSSKLTAGEKVRVIVPGFGPIDGVVTGIRQAGQ